MPIDIYDFPAHVTTLLHLDVGLSTCSFLLAAIRKVIRNRQVDPYLQSLNRKRSEAIAVIIWQFSDSRSAGDCHMCEVPYRLLMPRSSLSARS